MEKARKEGRFAFIIFLKGLKKAWSFKRYPGRKGPDMSETCINIDTILLIDIWKQSKPHAQTSRIYKDFSW